MSSVISSEEIKKIPPLPISVARLAQSMSDPNSTIEEISHVIELDPVLTGKILHWANSSWSHTQSEITSVWNAVVRLGSESILKLAVGHHVKSAMHNDCGGYALMENELWKHGVASALAAETLNKITSEIIPPSAFAAALMHDIGKLFLGRHFGQDDYQKVMQELGGTEEDSILEVEQRMTGTDHAQVGGQMAREWNIPEDMVKAIANHHVPNEDPDILTDTVYFSNMIARLIGNASGFEPENLAIHPDVVYRLKLSNQHIQTICTAVETEFENTAQKWEVG